MLIIQRFQTFFLLFKHLVHIESFLGAHMHTTIEFPHRLPDLIFHAHHVVGELVFLGDGLLQLVQQVALVLCKAFCSVFLTQAFDLLLFVISNGLLFLRCQCMPLLRFCGDSFDFGQQLLLLISLELVLFQLFFLHSEGGFQAVHLKPLAQICRVQPARSRHPAHQRFQGFSLLRLQGNHATGGPTEQQRGFGVACPVLEGVGQTSPLLLLDLLLRFESHVAHALVGGSSEHAAKAFLGALIRLFGLAPRASEKFLQVFVLRVQSLSLRQSVDRVLQLAEPEIALS
mmetsp:Transcript_15670/g.30092  ORF Transcript_15670/g.30092 Transcript_15670/m.30092 type:complete len:286 (-) Transcript_15670:757-1614(-)